MKIEVGSVYVNHDDKGIGEIPDDAKVDHVKFDEGNFYIIWYREIKPKSNYEDKD